VREELLVLVVLQQVRLTRISCTSRSEQAGSWHTFDVGISVTERWRRLVQIEGRTTELGWPEEPA